MKLHEEQTLIKQWRRQGLFTQEGSRSQVRKLLAGRNNERQLTEKKRTNKLIKKWQKKAGKQNKDKKCVKTPDK